MAHFQTNDQDATRRRGSYKEDEDGFLAIDLCRICGWGGIERSPDHGGYFNRELPGIAEDWPRMGPLCSHCDRRIPRFLDLNPDKAAALRALPDTAHAVRDLRAATGCPEAWANLWIDHPDGAISEPRPEPVPPCVYCGAPLPLPGPTKCPECGMASGPGSSI